MQEAGMMERIRCQYVVNYIGSVVTPDTLCLVTEFCPLGSLRKFMKTNTMNDLLKIRFCQDISRGMEYLHQNDIVHRDLKTDNVLVVSNNPFDPVTAKVTDFGTSRSFIESSQKLGIQHIGTPVYMAPEMTLQKDEVNEQMTLKSDVYSFAICMLEVWISKDPYDSIKFPDGESILKFVGAGKRLEIPNGCLFSEAIERCWQQDPRDRPSFQEVAIMLSKVYKGYTDGEANTCIDTLCVNENSKRKSYVPMETLSVEDKKEGTQELNQGETQQENKSLSSEGESE
ncbi:protein kinase domain containing protein [Entamoeba histolytica KU27]|nr:protein kinase domain containing protein [Entamoeba histolytica KU27]